MLNCVFQSNFWVVIECVIKIRKDGCSVFYKYDRDRVMKTIRSAERDGAMRVHTKDLYLSLSCIAHIRGIGIHKYPEISRNKYFFNTTKVGLFAGLYTEKWFSFSFHELWTFFVYITLSLPGHTISWIGLGRKLKRYHETAKECSTSVGFVIWANFFFLVYKVAMTVMWQKK